MKILVIEDERHAASRLKALITELLPEAELVDGMDSIATSVAWLRHEHAPDLIFCDIQLADGLSFEIFEHVKVNSPIIFTTAYDQYAIRAFKLNAVDYLLKPIDPKELSHAISKFKSFQIKPLLDIQNLQDLLQPNLREYKSRFMVKSGEKIMAVPSSEVAYFMSEQRFTFLHTQTGSQYILDYTLDQVESLVDPKQFFRLNRKYIATFGAIQEIYTYSNSRLKIKLKNCNDNDVLVSREKVGSFKEWLDK
jgi:DNA-binding LytR/AlgR family response regulator